jgi:cytochrome c-type biogenesis protein CcmH
MMFWIVVVVMIGSATLLAILPLLRTEKRVTAPAGSQFEGDIAVFKDQLAEIDRDLSRGVLNERDAESARSEISRRLIDASEKAKTDSVAGASTQNRNLFRNIAIVFAGISVPVIAAAMYVSNGSPNLLDQPLLARLDAQQENGGDNKILDLVERVETHLSANPDDDDGWEVIAPVYQRLGRYEDAVRAFENLVRLRGETEDRLSNLAEAIVLSQQGVVTQRAEMLFSRANALDETAIRPRFFLALGLNQESRFEEAVSAWEDLLDDATPQSAWAPGALDQLNMARSELGLPPAEPDNQAAAVMSMSQQEQQEMISAMVEGLAERLKDDPDNMADWQRLIRSYAVLGKPDQAVAALREARSVFVADQGALDDLNALSGSLGLATQN